MMGNVALVVLTVLLLQLLLAGAWLLGHWVVDVPARPARHWSGSALACAAALGLVLARDTLPTPLAIGLSNVLMVLTVLAMVRGMRLFLHLPLRDGEALALLALSLLVSVVAVPLLPPPWNGNAQATSTCGVMIWAFARAARDAVGVLRAEFNRRTAWLLLAPLGAAAGMAGLRLAGVVLGPARPLQVDTPLHVAVALVLLMVVLLVHGSMASMLVLRLVARLRRLSQHDALTGLLNRAEWWRQLQAQQRWLGRHGDAYAVLLLDIDHFKRINDTWGHAAGDAVLVAVSQSLVSQARDGDAVGRLGGEEFAVLLPRMDLATAQQLAERLRRQLAEMQILWKHQPLQITVSVGVAWSDDAGEGPAQLVERADRALYRAKREGRDRVVTAPAPA